MAGVVDALTFLVSAMVWMPIYAEVPRRMKSKFYSGYIIIHVTGYDAGELRSCQKHADAISFWVSRKALARARGTPDHHEYA